MLSIREITRNTLSAILRSKVLYLALILTILVATISIRQVFVLRMAAEAGDSEAVTAIQRTTLVGLFSFWSMVTISLGLYLGATAVWSEVKAKTIVSVLAKPVERWKFLVAKWLGIEIFLLAFFSLGLLVVSSVMWIYGAQVSALFWIGACRSFLLAVIISSASLAIGTVSSPVLAGALPYLLAMLGGFVSESLNDPEAWRRLLATAFHLLMPAKMPADLLSLSFRMGLLNPDYGLYFQVLLENALYAVVLLVLACVAFTRRELELR